jgi:hypothetical protein
MTPLLHGLMDGSAALGSALAASVWQGTILAACVWMCLRLLPGVSAAARSLVWMGVFVVVVGLHVGPFAESSAAAGQGNSIHIGIGWSVALAVVWGLLSLLRGTQFAVSAWHLRGVAERATPVELGCALPEIGRKYGICSSKEVDRPSVVGFLRPRVLLPVELLERLSAGEMEQVLLHETEHLRRRDDWTNLAQKLALVVFPIHPVLLWVERRLCLERELACDDCVLRVSGNPGAAKAYATCLTNLAEHRMVRRGVSLALGAWERQSELARRVHRILRLPEVGMPAPSLRWATAAMMVGLVGGGIALARGPELVSFGPEMQVASGQIPGLTLASAGFRQRASLAAMERSELPPRATLVQAVMPMTSFRGAGPAFRPEVSRAVKSRIPVRKRVAVKPRIAASTPRMMVTSWRASESQGRLILTVASGDRVLYRVVPAVERVPAYAAVPVSNGWLIFQL